MQKQLTFCRQVWNKFFCEFSRAAICGSSTRNLYDGSRFISACQTRILTENRNCTELTDHHQLVDIIIGAVVHPEREEAGNLLIMQTVPLETVEVGAHGQEEESGAVCLQLLELDLIIAACLAQQCIQAPKGQIINYKYSN
jgi:hypothetical protein